MTTHNVQVVLTEKHGWAVQVVDTDGATTHYSSQQEAIAAGAGKAKQDKVELVVHSEDGQVQRTASFHGTADDMRK